uniref:NADH-ubiquinone oxidoreductase chain 3 n=1 Tax=Haliclystus antarcticus TaxID=654955 RepID=A0A173FZN7_HALAN|nr:NADH dehydrogenase subunit 3 [Haliclystus antarcticus]ANH09492.1 NADH dehydrogenase subunit 3 [Haliclystus antarcticus]
MICVALAVILVGLSLVLQGRSPDREKNSVYECGFNPFQSPGQPFSIRFFLIALLFLVFDLEISFLFPWCKTLFQDTSVSWLALFFLTLLTWGLVYEWIKGALEWE